MKKGLYAVNFGGGQVDNHREIEGIFCLGSLSGGKWQDWRTCQRGYPYWQRAGCNVKNHHDRQ